MSARNEFYIGWQDNMPKSLGRFLRRVVILVFALIPILTFVVVKSQKPFNDHKFVFGKVQEFRGVYYEKPVPMLDVSDESVPEGIMSTLMLVGYGKFGAEGIMRDLAGDQLSLGGREVTLRGTLIWGDGLGLLELTEQENSLVDVHGMASSPASSADSPPPVQMAVSGEILDPKCYFGVMKPGEGKIHKSCAIRCISGGIPPVLRVDSDNPPYLIVLGPDGQKINQELLDYVAESVTFEGTVEQSRGWSVIYADPSSFSVE